MKTKLIVMRPDMPHETIEHDLPDDPGYDKLRQILEPLLDGANLEHVSVLASFNGGPEFKPSDMFVDDDGLNKRLPRNEAATVLYRRYWLTQNPKHDPESLSFICGPAILFDRRVWF